MLTSASLPLTSVLSHIHILPRRIWLLTPGVEATVPMLRGTWGAALYDLDRQAYRNVFGGEDDNQRNDNQRNNGAARSEHRPPGYLMRPAPPDARCAPAVDFFLFGQALEHDDACRHAWLEAAKRGLGSQRRAFQVRGTFLLSPSGTLWPEPHAANGGTPRSAFPTDANSQPLTPKTLPHANGGTPRSAFPTDPNSQSLTTSPLPPANGGTPRRAFPTDPGTPRSAFPTDAHPHPHAWPLSQAVWPLDAYGPCRLVFKAPLRLRRHGRLVEQPTLADLVVAACRQIEGFLPDRLRDDWKAYSAAALETARSRPPAAWQGARLDLHRWSARQQNELDLHGVTGSLSLAQGPGELAPLLAAAQWLHLGKATVMGLGQFEIEG